MGRDEKMTEKKKKEKTEETGFKTADKIDITEEEKRFLHEWNKFWEGMENMKVIAIQNAPENTSFHIRFRLGIFEGEVKYTSLLSRARPKWGPASAWQTGQDNRKLVEEMFNSVDVEISEVGDEIRIRPTIFLGDEWQGLMNQLNQYFDRESVKWNKRPKNEGYWSVPK